MLRISDAKIKMFVVVTVVSASCDSVVDVIEIIVVMTHLYTFTTIHRLWLRYSFNFVS